MSHPIHYVTMFTPEYVEVVARLKRSAEKAGVELDASMRPSRKDWAKNAAIKLEFIESVVDMDGGRNWICWLDADSEILEDPTEALLETGTPLIGMAWYPLKSSPICRPDTGERGRYHAGVILINPCIKPELFTAARRWLEGQKEWPQAPEEHALQQTMWDHDLEITELPRKCCQIFDKEQHEEPLILQHQVSRRFRKCIRYP